MLRRCIRGYGTARRPSSQVRRKQKKNVHPRDHECQHSRYLGLFSASVLWVIVLSAEGKEILQVGLPVI